MSLARLLEQATPRRLDPRTRTHVLYAAGANSAASYKGFDNEADALLDERAPEMAQLLIDMADALRPKGGHRIDCRAYRSYAACSCGYERNRELLARFAELDGQAKDTT